VYKYYLSMQITGCQTPSCCFFSSQLLPWSKTSLVMWLHILVVFLSHCSGVDYSRTVWYHTHKDITHICSHITTDLIIHWWTIIDYFNKV